MPQVRVLLVDNSEAFLDGVKSWLALEPLLELVGTARTGEQAVEQVERLKPDLVLMDVGMPDVSGFEATRRIKSGDDAPRIILLTLHGSEVARDEASAAGADGFVDKAEVTEELISAIRDLIHKTE